MKTLIHALSSIAASLMHARTFRGQVKATSWTSERLTAGDECAPSIHPTCFLLRRPPHITQQQHEHGAGVSYFTPPFFLSYLLTDTLLPDTLVLVVCFSPQAKSIGTRGMSRYASSEELCVH